MVLLGGLEFVAAGYLLAEHSKHKKERKRLELQNQHLLNYAVVPQPHPASHRRRRHSDSDRRPSAPPVSDFREKRRETERHRDSEKYRSSEKHREHSSDSKHHHHNNHHSSSSSSRQHKSSSSARPANSSRLALPLAAVAVASAAAPSRTNLTQPPRPSPQPRKSRRGSSAPPTPRQELIPYQPTPLHQHYSPIPPPPYPAYHAPSAPPSRARPSNHSYPPATPMVPSSSRPAPQPAPHRGSGVSGRSGATGHSYIPPREDAWELLASEVGHGRPARAGAMSPHVHFEDGLSTLKEPIEPPPPYREY